MSSVSPQDIEPSTSKGKEKEARKRSSKACDACKKAKCKCLRVTNENGQLGPCQQCQANNIECEFSATTKKRGPPRGYIEAIESRLHRMEALLGGLIANEDPRAQALLGELIGDEDARDVLTKDLKTAYLAGETVAQKQAKARAALDASPSLHSSNWLQAEEYSLLDRNSPAIPGTNGASHTLSGIQTNLSTSPNLSIDASATFEGASTSPRQRRKFSHPTSASLQPSSSSVLTLPPHGSPAIPYNVGSSENPLSPGTIRHTGSAFYSLSDAAAPSVQQADGKPQDLTELADVIGQLSLDENAEVRYHGRSSGLYMISKSNRFKDFFWQFPKAGAWPPSDKHHFRTDEDLVKAANATNKLPDAKTQDHLLDLYWAYVHPHLPVLYRTVFMRQYRATVHLETNPTQSDPKLGKVPSILLFAIYALAARYSDSDGCRDNGQYWTAGDSYMEAAKNILNQDLSSSRLTTCQALLLMAYREAGAGNMSSSWLYTGLAIRMSQDLGLFRDVDKWFIPVSKFTYEEKQTRKRIWWACICMDKYVSAYIGRPMAIFERDYDTGPPSEDVPDEHDVWRPLRPDGTDWEQEPISPYSEPILASRHPFPHDIKSNAISCFNRQASLAVLLSRINANIYAIRVRVLGQSSESLLALLDQALAKWYLELPPHLQYNPTSKTVPAPHVLVLHSAFYCALILLHRPFIPAANANKAPANFPSHSICTTSANAIANIATVYSREYTLRQAVPFMVYYIFTAAIMHVYNTNDPALAQSAKSNLLKCMRALKEMEMTWGSALRQWELLVGIVDLHDVELDLDRALVGESPPSHSKRTAEEEVPQPAFRDFDTRAVIDGTYQPPQQQAEQKRSTSSKRTASKPRRSSSRPAPKPSVVNNNNNNNNVAETSTSPTFSFSFDDAINMPLGYNQAQPFANSELPSNMNQQPDIQHSTYNILGLGDQNYPSTSFEASSSQTQPQNYPFDSSMAFDDLFGNYPTSMAVDPVTSYDPTTGAFFGVPISADEANWSQYLPNTFFGGASPMPQ